MKLTLFFLPHRNIRNDSFLKFSLKSYPHYPIYVVINLKRIYEFEDKPLVKY